MCIRDRYNNNTTTTNTHTRARTRAEEEEEQEQEQEQVLSLSFSKLTTVEDQNALFLSFERVVVQKFLDQIHVTHEHASTAVSLQLQRVQRVLLGVIRLQQIEVRVPLVSNHLFMRGERERERSRQTTREKTTPRGGRRSIDSASSLPSSSQKSDDEKSFATRSIDTKSHRNFCGSLSLTNEEDVVKKTNHEEMQNTNDTERASVERNAHLAAGETPDRDYHDKGASFVLETKCDSQ